MADILVMAGLIRIEVAKHKPNEVPEGAIEPVFDLILGPTLPIEYLPMNFWTMHQRVPTCACSSYMRFNSSSLH